MKRIAIFASGSGSNAKKILEYFEGKSDREVALIVTNKRNAGVLDHAKEFGIPALYMNRAFFKKEGILAILKSEKIDLIVLAGFLWLIPIYLIQAFPNKILNIHPSLLPKYGGKGMYGHYVHEAVKANKEQQSGMTIHYVNEAFDEGTHIFQDSVDLDAKDTASDIATKVLKLEHMHYPRIVDEVLSNQG